MSPAIAKVRRCRVCGCTDERACPEGCAWAETDLCTACQEVVAALSEWLGDRDFPARTWIALNRELASTTGVVLKPNKSRKESADPT